MHGGQSVSNNFHLPAVKRFTYAGPRAFDGAAGPAGAISGAHEADDRAPLGGAGAAADVLHAEVIDRARREVVHDHQLGGRETAAVRPRAAGADVGRHRASNLTADIEAETQGGVSSDNALKVQTTRGNA